MPNPDINLFEHVPGLIIACLCIIIAILCAKAQADREDSEDKL